MQTYHRLINELVNDSKKNIMSQFAVEKSLINKSFVNQWIFNDSSQGRFYKGPQERVAAQRETSKKFSLTYRERSDKPLDN